MKKSTTTLFFCFLITATFAQSRGNFKTAQRSANANELQYSNADLRQQSQHIAKNAVLIGENIVEISINALSNKKADSYTVIFNVIQLGKTADETNAALTTRLDPFINDMKAVGAKQEDIYIDMVNFLPKYEYDVSKKLFSKKTYTEIPIGFELQKNVHVRFTDPLFLDKIVAAAAKYEIYDIVKVDYFVKNSKDIYAELRKASLEYLKEIKANYKGIVPLDSAYTLTAENTWVTYPTDQYQSYQAFSTQSLDANQRADSKVERVDKPVSQFYNAIPANDYDIVINPEILEPCVQYTYNLVARFTIKEREKPKSQQKNKEVYIVTADGSIVPIKID